MKQCSQRICAFLYVSTFALATARNRSPQSASPEIRQIAGSMAIER